jgi:hypothetical protein
MSDLGPDIHGVEIFAGPSAIEEKNLWSAFWVMTAQNRNMRKRSIANQIEEQKKRVNRSNVALVLQGKLTLFGFSDLLFVHS